MCGILGVSITKQSEIGKYDYQKLVKNLLINSQSRGKESSGIAFNNGKKIQVIKTAHSANKLIKSNEYKNLINQSVKNHQFLSVIGHARLVTNGSMAENDNNQPVIKDGIVGIHNGIITNDQFLWQKFKKLKRKYQVDTEVLFSLIKHFYKNEKSVIKAINKSYKYIEGSASIAAYFDNYDILTLATNTGSLYFYHDKKNRIFIFASEKYILKKSIKFLFKDNSFEKNIIHIEPWSGGVMDLANLEFHQFNFNDKKILKIPDRKISALISDSSSQSKFSDYQIHNKLSKKDLKGFNKEYQKSKAKINKLVRCTKCILPETMPYISFDKKGVCNYCHNHEPIKLKKKSHFEKIITQIKKENKNREHDCLLAFSGGRDSSYALHLLCKEFGLRPVVYSYDWGMITDLGRRNQARMCGKLGVEQILHSANIAKKRENIRKNILAWLTNPELGMIPLFMAGDKQYFYYLNKTAKQMRIKDIFYSSNPLEKTYFKYGFAGIGKFIKNPKTRAYNIGPVNESKLIWYYLKQFIKNPKYLNSSIFDTISAYYSSYTTQKPYYYLFNYIEWEENKVNKTLLEEYNWEISPDTDATWRIGDGTASFYNYIYYKVAGFTENDTFRSNQIREGLLTRQKALKICEKENEPRWESIKWYCDTIGLDLKTTIKKINQIKTLY